MTSQEEWREIAYQRQLGESGFATGNIHNQRGVDDFLDRQRRQEEYDRAVFEQSAVVHDTGSSAIRYGTRPGPPSPIGSALLLALFAGAGVGLYGNSWYSGALAALVAFATLAALIAFFRSELGQIVAFLIGFVIGASLFALAIWFVWHEFGAKYALWILGGVGAVIGVRLLGAYAAYRYRRFKKTARGARVHRTLQRSVVVTLWGSVAVGGLWAARNLGFI